jgi:hypothetical protein
MAKQQQPHKDDITTPSQFGQAPPPVQPHDFSYLEIVMELQKSMAQMSEKLHGLSEASKAHDTKLDQISHQVFAAKVVLYVVGGIVAIAGSVIGFLIKEGVDYLIHRPAPH